MNEIYVTVSGNVIADPSLRATRNGVPFAAFRLASTVRRQNKDGEYEDGPTNYLNVTAFRSLGANIAKSVHKGDPVVVHGRMRVNQFVRQDNSHGTSVEIDAYSVGHDLGRGVTTFSRVSKAQFEDSDRLADESVQQALEEQMNPDTDPYEVLDEPPSSSLIHGVPGESVPGESAAFVAV